MSDVVDALGMGVIKVGALLLAIEIGLSWMRAGTVGTRGLEDPND